MSMSPELGGVGGAEPPMVTPVLLLGVDDQVQEQAHAILSAEGIGPIATFADANEAMPYLDHHPCELLLVDIGRGAGQDIGMIGRITSAHPGVVVVAISQADEAAVAVSCIHQGAYDFVPCPIIGDHLVDVVRRALGLKRIKQIPVFSHPGKEDAFSELVTEDPGMLKVFAHARAVARSGQSILITGETGTGKDLLARAVHHLSGCPGDYVAVNIAGMDDTMLADCLFGHRKGAFTGASDIRPGLVLAASAGSLFLDEIGDLALVSQVKLLRLLQDGEYYPLGSDSPKHSTARIIAATSSDLGVLKAKGGFRKDLYYRLRAHALELPPLRSRPRDVPVLARHFAAVAAADLGHEPVEVGQAALDLLAKLRFPGNVRELRSLIYDAVSRTPPGEPLSLDPFLHAVAEAAAAADDSGGYRVSDSGPDDGIRFPDPLPSLAEADAALVREALRRSAGNQALAASWLGISRQALHKRLHR